MMITEYAYLGGLGVYKWIICLGVVKDLDDKKDFT